MRKFTVTTTISKEGTYHKIRSPVKTIKMGDIIRFTFNDCTLTAIVVKWDDVKRCNACVLFHGSSRKARCVHFNTMEGHERLLCNSGDESFLFKSINELMEEI